MAPAMAALSAIGEAGLVLSQWSGLLELNTKVPPVYCKKCEVDIAFREYAEHLAIHMRNTEAEEEIDEATMKCPVQSCSRHIRLSKYADHALQHEVANAAHQHAIKLEAKEAARSDRTGNISRGYVKVKRPITARNKE